MDESWLAWGRPFETQPESATHVRDAATAVFNKCTGFVPVLRKIEKARPAISNCANSQGQFDDRITLLTLKSRPSAPHNKTAPVPFVNERKVLIAYEAGSNGGKVSGYRYGLKASSPINDCACHRSH
jgi:hypothetical protein